jgi:hypothetical protein
MSTEKMLICVTSYLGMIKFLVAATYTTWEPCLEAYGTAANLEKASPRYEPNKKH